MNGETAVLRDIPGIGVGILGYGYASRAHIIALKRIREVYWPPSVLPRCVSICGRTESKVREAAARYEIKKWFTDWREMITDPEIQVFDNCGTNDAHSDSCIEAAHRGLHLVFVRAEKTTNRSKSTDPRDRSTLTWRK